MKNRIAMGGVLAAGVVLLASGCGKKAAEVSAELDTTGTELLTDAGTQTEDDMTESETLEEDEYSTEDGVVPGWKKNADTPVTLDWYINYSWFTTVWGNNLVSQTITEQTGVDVNFITPAGNETEKLNALMTSGSLPDLVTLGWWESQVNEMIDGGFVYALNELADEYDMYFYEVSDPTAVNWYTQEDGNIYCYPNSSYTPQDIEENDNIGSNETFLVRKDIYEALGSPDMTTTEGFEAAVKAAAEMFPEVDGEPLIPVGAHVFNDQGNCSFDTYLMNFLAVPYEKDGEVYDRYTDDDYLKWLKMFRRLGAEGYLANDIFIDQRTQMEEKLEKGRYFCMLYQYTDMIAEEKVLYAKNPEKIYIAVDGPKSSSGADYRVPTTGINGWTVTLISKNCKNPDRAIQFLDYLMSEEGQMITYLGVEGVTYDMVDGKPVLRQEVSDLLNSDRVKYDELYGADDTYWMLQDNVMQLQWKQEGREPIAQLEEWSYPYIYYNAQYDSMMPPDSMEANAEAQIKLLWSKTLPRLLLASTQEEFDKMFEEYIIQRDELGFDEVSQMKTKLLEQAKEKLGIE